MADVEQRVLAALEDLGKPYRVIEIDPRHADTADFCRVYGVPLERSANTILVASKKEPRRFVACVLLAHTRLDVNRAVRKRLGVPRASFATGEEMQALTGMEVGGVTVFGLPEGVPIWVDERVMEPDLVVLGAGGRSRKIEIAPRTLVDLGAEVVSDLALEPRRDG